MLRDDDTDMLTGGRFLLSRVLRPQAGPSPLAQAIADLKAEARRAGLGDAEIDAELSAYRNESRGRR